MNDKNFNEKYAIASIKLAIIQPAFNGTYPDMTKKAYYERIAVKPVRLPDGTEKKYSAGTYACWESAYRKGGFDALIPKERCDKGFTRRLDADQIAAIYSIREKYPRITATGIRDKMIADGLLNRCDASVSTFQRFISKNNLKGASAPGKKDRRAFEAETAAELYQADTLYGPYIPDNGTNRRTYCIMIIDDRTRLIVGGRFFFQDNAVNFQQVLKDAVATYGIPQKLYVDNGSPYKNNQLSLICGQIGTVLIHTPIGDGASKGKVERNFRTLRTRFLDRLDMDTVKDIDTFNALLTEYIRNFNTSVHSATGMAPITRYMEDTAHIRMPKNSGWLDGCFLYRVSRKVRNDSTVMIDGRSFDVPMEFIRSKVEVRYRPGDYDSAFIYDSAGGKSYPIRLTDKVANSKIRRSNKYSINYGGAGL